MALWYWDGYRLYATCILVISVISCVTQLVETLQNLRNVRKMAHYTCSVEVLRENKFQYANSNDLVPGDVIKVPDNCTIPCDLILLSGSCIVNESMLTGESIPVIKSSIPKTSEVYNPEYD